MSGYKRDSRSPSGRHFNKSKTPLNSRETKFNYAAGLESYSENKSVTESQPSRARASEVALETVHNRLSVSPHRPAVDRRASLTATHVQASQYNNSSTPRGIVTYRPVPSQRSQPLTTAEVESAASSLITDQSRVPSTPPQPRAERLSESGADHVSISSGEEAPPVDRRQPRAAQRPIFRTASQSPRTVARRRAYERAREAVLDRSDHQLQSLLRRRVYALPPDRRPTSEHVIGQVAQFLHVTGFRLEARRAARFLAEADWHFATALENHMAERYPDLTFDSSKEATEKPASSRRKEKVKALTSTEQSAEYSEEDSGIPQEITPTTGRDPESRRMVPAVYHWQIRQYLIARDRQRYGPYVHGRARGHGKDDRTARHPDQLDWGFKVREHYPSVIFLIHPPEERITPWYKVSSMYWRGHLVLDVNNSPIKDFRNLPSTLASSVEGGLMEALTRTDPRIRHGDLRARTPPTHPTTSVPTDQQLKGRENALAQRMRRFREVVGCLPWKSKSDKTAKAMKEFLYDNIPDHFRKENTTKGFRNLTEEERDRVKFQQIGRYANRSKNKNPEKRKEYLTDFLRRRMKRQRRIGVQPPFLSQEGPSIDELLARNIQAQECNSDSESMKSGGADADKGSTNNEDEDASSKSTPRSFAGDNRDELDPRTSSQGKEKEKAEQKETKETQKRDFMKDSKSEREREGKTKKRKLVTDEIMDDDADDEGTSDSK